jgi:DNA-binding transcriptional regulator LsrR (DeoR family)
LNLRAIALPLSELSRIPTVVLASGGQNKIPAIAAALRARFGSVIICDEDTARAARDLALASEVAMKPRTRKHRSRQ